MAINHEIEIFSQESIYNQVNDGKYNRKLKVFFSLPDNGVSRDTGLLLLIAGYGAHSSSTVYKKMREKFSDDYNLVTIQCDYFGFEFMQDNLPILPFQLPVEELKKVFSDLEIKEIYKGNLFDFDAFLNVSSQYEGNFKVYADMSAETPDYFNDMGILQATDNIVAVFNVMNILYDNDFCFNSKKVMIYGQSQGAYLAYLCNAFAPTFFSFIIDNSAWLLPAYLETNRGIAYQVGKVKLDVVVKYLVREMNMDREILDLNFLYSQFKNNCTIISYHGTNDILVSHREKAQFCKKVNQCIYHEINLNNVDGNIFKSNKHGLGANFLALFDLIMEKYALDFDQDSTFTLPNTVVYNTTKSKYTIDYTNVFPKLTIT